MSTILATDTLPEVTCTTSPLIIQAISTEDHASTASPGRPTGAHCPSGQPTGANDFAPVAYFQPSTTDGITGSRKRPLEFDDEVNEHPRKRANLSYTRIVVSNSGFTHSSTYFNEQQKQSAIVQSDSPNSIINQRKHRQEVDVTATKHQAPVLRSGTPHSINSRQMYRSEFSVEVANNHTIVLQSNSPSSLIHSREHRPEVINEAKEDPFQQIKLQKKQIQDAKARSSVNGNKYDGNFLNSYVSVKAAPTAGIARAIVPRKRGTKEAATSRAINNLQVEETRSQRSNFFAKITATANADAIHDRQRDAQGPWCHHGETDQGLGLEKNLIGNIDLIHELTDCGEENPGSSHCSRNISGEFEKRPKGTAAGAGKILFGDKDETSNNNGHSPDVQQPTEAAGSSTSGNGEGNRSQKGLFETQDDFDRFVDESVNESVDESVDEWDILRNTDYGVKPFQSKAHASYPDLDPQKTMALTPPPPLPQTESTTAKALLHSPASTHYLSKHPLEATNESFIAVAPALFKSAPSLRRVTETTQAKPHPSPCHIEGYIQSAYGIPKHIYDAKESNSTHQPLGNANDPTHEDRIFLESYYFNRPAAVNDLEEHVLLLRPLIEEMGAIPASRKAVPTLTSTKATLEKQLQQRTKPQ